LCIISIHAIIISDLLRVLICSEIEQQNEPTERERDRERERRLMNITLMGCGILMQLNCIYNKVDGNSPKIFQIHYKKRYAAT
jgi:hypothetical protein